MHSPTLHWQLRIQSVNTTAYIRSDDTYELPQLQEEEPHPLALDLFFGGSPQAQLGQEQSVLEVWVVVHLTSAG